MFPDDYSPIDPKGHSHVLNAPGWLEHALLNGQLSVRRHVQPFPGLSGAIVAAWALTVALPGNVDVIILTQRDRVKVDDTHREMLDLQKNLRRERKKREEERRKDEQIRADIRAYVAAMTEEERAAWQAERQKRHDEMRADFLRKFNHDIGEYEPCL